MSRRACRPPAKRMRAPRWMRHCANCWNTGCGSARQGARHVERTTGRAGFGPARAGNRGARTHRGSFAAMSAQAPRVVLASTSRYRAKLLRRLLPEFQQAAPRVQETEIPGETPRRRAERLALLKAAAVAAGCDHSLVIGSDQVAELDGRILRKPGELGVAREQLRACSGREVHFHTAVCV